MRKLMLLFATIVAAISFGASATVAQAAYNGGAVYDNGATCVKNQSWMTSGWNGVNTLSLTNTPWFQWPTTTCGYNNWKPEGYLAAAWDYHRWNGYNWVFCGSQGWEFGGGSQLNMGRNTTGCGSGYYWMWGGSYVKNGEEWLGGWVGVGYEWLNF